MTQNSSRLLITGVSGLLGNNLARYFRDKFDIIGLYCSHPVTIKGICTEKCDLSSGHAVKTIIHDFSPSVIIHCASLTNIDQCEIEKDLTKKINTLSTKDIVEDIISKDIKLIYISSDAVYDGVKGDFSEDDSVNPLNYYGLSKYEGELEVLRKKDSLILRTNIFGWNIQNKKSLGEWILQELQAGRKIRCFKDAYFSTIYTMEFARAIDIALQNGLTGVYNCAGSTAFSKYEFATKIADCFGLDERLILPIPIDESNFKAIRGKNLTLDVSKFQRVLNYKLPTIEQSVEAFYRDYKCGLPDRIKQSLVKPEPQSLSYGRHWVDSSDIQSVVNTLHSDRLTQGGKIEEFEKSLAEYCSASYAVAVCNGTAALHLACLAAGIGDNHDVITSTITFVASANCIVYCNGRPVLVDIDIDTYNIEPDEIKKNITVNTKGIIPVHFAGLPCDMESISNIAREYNLVVIEDACHALGSEWFGSDGKWHKVGACSHSDMAVFSFHPVKHITTGEGGAVLTNNPEIYEKLLLLRSHGITKTAGKFLNKKLAFSSDTELNPWYYEMQDLGFNYRITDFQCALGISQLKKLESFLERRREIARMYNEVFKKFSCLKIPTEPKTRRSAWHLYVVMMDFEKLGWDRFSLMTDLGRKGIGLQVHYIPVHLQPYYKKHLGYKSGDYPIAENYYSKAVSLPIFPRMTDKDVERVVDAIVDRFK